MAACPPGLILNPRTLRCIRPTGKKAQELVRQGNIAEVELAVADAYRRRRTMRRAPAQPRFIGECPPGTRRNPATGRCIKIAGRVYKKQFEPPLPPVPELEPLPFQPLPPPPQQLPYRHLLSQPQPQPQPFQPKLQLQPQPQPQPKPTSLPSVAPMADKATILGWTAKNCANDRDPITGASFRSTDTATLHELIRLHNRTCALASPLHTRIAAQHFEGKIATIPGDPLRAPMSLDDFAALRTAMRRRNPAYKIPGRRHQPPPPEWQLYISTDSRSGPEFATVQLVDVTKARRGPYGPEFPPESVMMDLGFIPVSPAAISRAACSPTMVAELLHRLSKANKLVHPVAGGWKPIAGFPHSKQHWKSDASAKLDRLCRHLADELKKEHPV